MTKTGKFWWWLVYLLCGLSLLAYFSWQAVESERRFFAELLLANNRDLGLLSARHLVSELKQLRTQMDGFAGLIVKENFVKERLRDHLRFNIDGHRFIVGVRYRAQDGTDWQSFLNTGFSLASPSFFVADEHRLIKQCIELKRLYFSDVKKVQNEFLVSLFLPVRDLRQNIIAGIIEVCFSLTRMLELTNSISNDGHRMVLLVDDKANIINSRTDGWTISEPEYLYMNKNPLNSMTRYVFQEIELLSWCSLSVLEPLQTPNWFILVAEDGTEYDKFSNRMSFNIYALAVFGFLCLIYLGRLLFFNTAYRVTKETTA